MPAGSRPVAPQGDVDVVPEPGGQGDMPAPPEVRDGNRQIGAVEVLQKVEAEHTTHADGHVAVPGEVEVNLQGVGQGPQPGHGGGGRVGVEGAVGHQGHGVGQDALLPKAHDQAGHAVAEVRPGGDAVVNLQGHGLIADDRPGDELGEEGHVQPHIQHAALGGGFAPVDVDDVAHGLEGVEGDADGQGQLYRRHRQAHEPQILAHKAQIFKDEQTGQVERHRPDERRPAAGLVRAHLPAQQPVDQDGQHQQQHIHRLPPGVEEQGDQQQQRISVPQAAEKGDVVQQQGTG